MEYLLLLSVLFFSGTAQAQRGPHIRRASPREYVNLRLAEVAEMTRTVNSDHLRLSMEMVKKDIRTSVENCNPFVRYRSIDGSCNNLYRPDWGAPMRPQRRLLKAAYDDGKDKPRLFRGGKTTLPSARTVSQACFPYDDDSKLDDKYSTMTMQWGQFLDHDITGTPEGEENHECCRDILADGSHPDYNTNGTCFPIYVERGDRSYTNINCLNFIRSVPEYKYGVREQVNAITAYIDASNVYGSSDEELMANRAPNGGRGLLNLAEDHMLLQNASVLRPCVEEDIGACLYSGDVRVNEFPPLSSVHNLFHREHNRIARILAVLNPHWDGERLFQETRKIIAAYMQVITWKEFLPIVLGPRGMDRFALNKAYRYDPQLNPEIINSFSTAAFRFGHSLLPGTFETLRNRRQKIETMFFRPSFTTNGQGQGYNVLLNGLISSSCQKMDKFFNKGISDSLFKDIPEPGVTFDLPARNIQRARDHGLPSYSKYRSLMEQYYPKYRVLRMNSRRNPKIRSRYVVYQQPAGPSYTDLDAQCLRAYNYRYEDVDLFVGGITERPVDDGLLGQTFAAILGNQFFRLKNGDRFWYETMDRKVGFTPAQVEALSRVRMAGILCDNTNIPHLQGKVMEMPNTQTNPVVSCAGSAIPRLDLSLWQTLG